MTTTQHTNNAGRDTGLLGALRDQQQAIADAEITLLQMITDWASENTVHPDSDDAAMFEDDRGMDLGVPLTGAGAPVVSEAALIELCAALRRPTLSGRHYVGKVIELGYRLPRIWQRVKDGEVPVWRALRIAEHTQLLPANAACHVDRQLVRFAHSCSWAQLDRLVEEALIRFDPDTAEEKRERSAEQRHFDIYTDHVSFNGTVEVVGRVDLADGLDLEAAIARRANILGQLGCEESLDVRRSMAAGELARTDLALDLPIDTEQGTTPKVAQGRKVELVVHTTADEVNGESPNPVARCGNTRSPISPEQLKNWCGTPGSTVIVRPVIDLAGHDQVEAYEIPDRHHRQVEYRDITCRFPFCTTPAKRCDTDHAEPYDSGGETCPCNLVALCRTHHRAKTFAGWSYTILEPGSYLWISPAGYQYAVDGVGTSDLGQPPGR